MNQNFSLRVTCLTAALGLGAGCSTTPPVPPKKVELSEPKLNTDTCFKERIKTTTIGTGEDSKIKKDAIPDSYDLTCKREKTDKGLLHAQVAVDIAKIKEHSKHLIALLQAENVPADEKVDAVRQISANLSDSSHVVRMAQIEALADTNMSLQDLLRTEVLGLINLYLTEEGPMKGQVAEELVRLHRAAEITDPDLAKAAPGIVEQELALEGLTMKGNVVPTLLRYKPTGFSAYCIDVGEAIANAKAMTNAQGQSGKIVLDLSQQECGSIDTIKIYGVSPETPAPESAPEPAAQ